MDVDHVPVSGRRAARRRLVRRCRSSRRRFRRLGARALQVAYAHVHELDVLADRVVAGKGRVALVVALPLLGELDRLDLAALVLDACDDIEGSRGSTRAVRDADAARDARDVVALLIFGPRAGVTLKHFRLRDLERDLELLLRSNGGRFSNALAARLIAFAHARAARCRLALRYVFPGGASLIGRGCRASAAEDLLRVCDRNRGDCEGRHKEQGRDADAGHFSASDDESRLGSSSNHAPLSVSPGLLGGDLPRPWPSDPTLCRRGVAQAVDCRGFSHFGSFKGGLRAVGAESLRRGTLVLVTDAVIDEVLAPIAAPRNRPAVRRDEAQRVVGFLDDAKSAFVQQPVVIRTEQRHVLGLRLAAVDPMLQVMAVEIAHAMTTRERAMTIAGVERSTQRRRDRALLAADGERLAVCILEHGHEAAVAEQALDRLDG